MDTNNKIRKKPVFTGFLRTIYAALCGNIRGFSRFTPLEIRCSTSVLPRVRIPLSPLFLHSFHERPEEHHADKECENITYTLSAKHTVHTDY